MLTLFDVDFTGVPIDTRPQSNTPAQSLFWLNSPLPQYFAGRFAERLLKMDQLNDIEARRDGVPDRRSAIRRAGRRRTRRWRTSHSANRTG